MTTKSRRIVADGVGRLPVFSHAATAGNLIFVSGTLGTASGGIQLVPGGIGPETKQTLENIRTILETAGSSLAEVVKVSVYVTDMADFGAMNEAYAEFFPADPPARITLQVAGLALGASVEIECVALHP
ncbi:MAG: RidA family protein [bacterium]|nr:RidA family protein [bacterium]